MFFCSEYFVVRCAQRVGSRRSQVSGIFDQSMESARFKFGTVRDRPARRPRLCGTKVRKVHCGLQHPENVRLRLAAGVGGSVKTMPAGTIAHSRFPVLKQTDRGGTRITRLRMLRGLPVAAGRALHRARQRRRSRSAEGAELEEGTPVWSRWLHPQLFIASHSAHCHGQSCARRDGHGGRLASPSSVTVPPPCPNHDGGYY